MPPTFQQITPLPNDLFHIVKKGTPADSWVSAGTATTLGDASGQAQDLVQPPTNAYQAMVLAPAVAFQKAS